MPRFEPVRRAARAALIAPIRLYKRFLSPALGHHCRFTPTCSEYAMEAIRIHGCLKGPLLAAWRILRCNPFGKWGYDPVPAKGRWTSPARILHPARRKKT